MRPFSGTEVCMKRSFNSAVLGMLAVAAFASADYLFPSSNPPGNLSPSDPSVKQYVTFIFDDNGYSGANKTQYEGVPGVIKWADRDAVGGSDASGTTKNSLNIKEGDMGIAWATSKLGALKNPDGSAVHLTFNMITGLFIPTWGPSWQDRQSKFGSYADPAQPFVDGVSGFKNIAVAWGREQQIGTSAGASDVQPNYMLDYVTSHIVNAGHEIGNHTIDHMETNSPLPKSEFDKWGGDGFDPGVDTMPDGTPCTPDEATTFGIQNPNAYALTHGWNMFAGMSIGKAAWKGAIKLGEDQLDYYLHVSVAKTNLFSFRAPRLEVNSNLYLALKELGYTYDCGLEEGYGTEDSAATALWPYTLDNGSPNAWTQKSNGEKVYLNEMPTGLWEIPVNCVVVPDTLRARIYAKYHAICKGAGENWAFNADSVTSDSMDWCYGGSGGKVTCFDFNMFILYGMSGSEFLTTMKYNLDQRLAHGKAPMQLGCHTDYYTPIYDNATLQSNFNKNSYGLNVTKKWNTWTDRKAAVLAFAQYAISKGAYLVSGKELIDATKALASRDIPGKSTLVNGSWNFFDDSKGATPSVGYFNNSASGVSVTVPSSLSSCGYELTFQSGSLAALDHISLTYQSSSALSLILTTESGATWTALLNNIGPSVNSGTIPISAFRGSSGNGTDSILDPSKIVSIDLGVLNENEATPKPVTFSMSDFTVYGPANPVAITAIRSNRILPQAGVAFSSLSHNGLRLNFGTPGVCNISLLTLSGRVVKSFSGVHANKGSNLFDVGLLAKGSYIISVQGVKFNRTMKAILD